MSVVEDRLREQLPQLAEALVSATEAQTSPTAGETPGSYAVTATAHRQPGRRRRPAVLAALGVAAAAMLVLVGVLVTLDRRDGTGGDLGDDIGDDFGEGAADPAAPLPQMPRDFGTWSPVAEAPIDPRPYAVSAWTGTEAVFWAGSSLSRGFAYSDGAAYDPRTDSWRNLDGPGWGHPGLTSAFFDGELYALAKGGGGRFDPVAGAWVDLPHVEGMYLAATVATDEAVWGLGPAGSNPIGQPDLAIARYDPANDSWVYGPVYEGTGAKAEIVAGLSRLETDVVWTGREIVAWNGTSGGIAFDPATQQWRAIEPPAPPLPTAAPLSDSRIVMTEAGLVAIVEPEGGGGSELAVVVRVGDGWSLRTSAIPIAAPQTLTLAAAGEWLVLFSDQDAPVTVHVPTGEWKRHDDGPLAGLNGPNAVWTGDQLVVWGGVATPSAANPEPSEGATWTPPE